MSTAFLLVIGAVIGQTATGQDAAQRDSPQQDSAQAKQASLERMFADLGEFELSIGAEPPKKLALSGAAVLRWSYPIRNVDDAAAFVWLGAERPEAVATVMSYRDRTQNLRRAYEFVSLSPHPLAAVQGGRRVWHPQKPGFTWQAVPDAPMPAEAAALRRRQMHDLAAKFHVAVESDKNRYELRLLSQPLYRYQSAKADILDGSLFALAEGTDPELILALESPVEKPGWKFAVARLTRWAVEIRYQDKKVGQFEALTGDVDGSDVYHIWDAGAIEPASKPQATRRGR
jgi:hypothetical protein